MTIFSTDYGALSYIAVIFVGILLGILLEAAMSYPTTSGCVFTLLVLGSLTIVLYNIDPGLAGFLWVGIILRVVMDSITGGSPL